MPIINNLRKLSLKQWFGYFFILMITTLVYKNVAERQWEDYCLASLIGLLALAAWTLSVMETQDNG